MTGKPNLTSNQVRLLSNARVVWPQAKAVMARARHCCDWNRCAAQIIKGQIYIDPGDSNPDRAGGFGGYRFCMMHFDSAQPFVRSENTETTEVPNV